MTKYLIGIFLSALFSNPIIAQYPQMNFPLNGGNLWQYSEAPGYYSESKVIKDTLMPNGLTYTQITGELFSGFFRKEYSKVYLYNLSSNDESLFYDFSLKSGDTLFINISESDTIVKTVYEEGMLEIFGLQRNYMAFLTKHSSSTLYGIHYVTDGFGFTGYHGEVLSYGLTGAIINGIQYGVILEAFQTEKNLPIKYQLLQNYPNPFNPRTTIEFFINESGNIKIDIYDVLGNHITTLIDEYKNSGTYRVPFNGDKLPSGLYFYSMRFNSIQETKQMLLLK